ncbi:Cleavage and polyadenylation specificity factor subunit 2, partial [Tetrabaena socialis]
VPSLPEPGFAAGKVGESEAMDVEGGPSSAAAEGGGGEDVADEVEEAPTKLLVKEVELELRAALRFYDFEGRSDGRAMREYLGRVAPRRLALVHGSAAARAELAGALRHDLAEYGTEVFTPGTGEAVEARLASSQMAALGPGLADLVTVRQAGQYGVAWL